MLVNSGKKRLIWVSPLILDVDFHKTTQMEILQALANRGYEVSLIASRSSRKGNYQPANLHVITFPLKHVPLLSTAAYISLVALLLPILFLRFRPDFVIVEPPTTIHGAEMKLLFARSLKFKVILDIRSGPVGKHGRAIGLSFDLGVSLAKRFFDGITTITSLSKRKICQSYGVTLESVGVWTSGVSTALFSPQPDIGHRMRRKFGLADKFVVFYHGSFGSKEVPRGIEETIKAIGLLKDECPDLSLFLLGSGSIDLRQMVESSGLQDKVIVHDPVDYQNVPRYIAMCNVGIVPLPDFSYWRHQCPLNLLEYLAMNKVVIATDIPANREILDDSRCGIYFSSPDPQKIADAVRFAHENREMLGKWANVGRTIVEKGYSWDKVSKDLDSYLSNLLI